RLQNLKVLDLVGIEVRETVDGVVLDGGCPGTGGTRHRVDARRECRVGEDDAIDDVQRFAVAEDRGDAADLNLRAAARSTGVHVDRRADNFPLERVLERGRRGLAD